MSVTPVLLAGFYQRAMADNRYRESSASTGWFRFVLALYMPLLRGGLRLKPVMIDLGLPRAHRFCHPAGAEQDHAEFFPRIDARSVALAQSGTGRVLD